MIYAGRALLSLLFACPGAFLVWATGRAIRRRRLWFVDGVVTEGEVVGFKERSVRGSASKVTMLTPVVTFTRADGQSGRFTSSEGAQVSPYAIGQKVLVRYLASKPSEVELDVVARGYWAILAIAALATGCFLVASIPIWVTLMERHH